MNRRCLREHPELFYCIRPLHGALRTPSVTDVWPVSNTLLNKTGMLPAVGRKTKKPNAHGSRQVIPCRASSFSGLTSFPRTICPSEDNKTLFSDSTMCFVRKRQRTMIHALPSFSPLLTWVTPRKVFEGVRITFRIPGILRQG